ncbi:MAG: ribosome maturation factor RimP [Gemmatimonadota bacterium]
MPDGLESAIEQVVDELGYELVVLERGGGRRRPLLRLRIGRPGDRPRRSSLTADDCAAVSRAVMEMLEAREDAGSDFVLEVSSPGIDRPLVRTADYERFAGEPVRVRGYAPIIDGRKQVDAVLLGLETEDEEVLLDVDGERVAVPVSAIARANLRYSPFDGE